jgi:carbonic anhydrase
MARKVFRCSALVALLSAAVMVRPSVAQEFKYFGPEGPSHWGDVPGWETCGTGVHQSPIDITAGLLAEPSTVVPVQYDPATTGEIFNNGHTIEIETEGANTLTLDGVAYELVQFHFHTGSEHRVQGRGYDLEAHFVHKSAAGTNAVVGVFLKRGTSSGPFAPIFDSLPDTINVKEPLAAPFDPRAFFPAGSKYWRYTGSLTTPPCTEGVKWLVFQTTMTISDEHLAQFAERIHFNARYVQPFNPPNLTVALRAESTAGAPLAAPLTIQQPAIGAATTPVSVYLPLTGGPVSIVFPPSVNGCAFQRVRLSSGEVVPTRYINGSLKASEEIVGLYSCPVP